MIKSPCYNTTTKEDCPKRAAGCAATCTAWKAYEAARNEAYKEKFKATQTPTDLYGMANTLRKKIRV